MGRSFTITLPYPTVTGNHATKHARGRHYTTDAARDYVSNVFETLAILGVSSLKLPGPLSVDYLAIPPDAKARDSDNVMKVVKDALTRGGFWVDDSNKVIIKESFSWYPKAESGDSVVVVVREL